MVQTKLKAHTNGQIQYIKICQNPKDVVAHAYYIGGRGRRILRWGPAQGKLERPHLKKWGEG
jgi:hypothetical protein